VGRSSATKMERFRFSILGLMATILVVAVVLAFFRDAVEILTLFSGEILTLVVFLLLISIIMAWWRRGRSRAFWRGLVLFGWGYLILWITPIEPYLPTTSRLDELYSLFKPTQTQGIDPFEAVEVRDRQQEQQARFRRACHSLVTLFLALLGGFALSVLAKSDREDREVPIQPEGSLLRSGYTKEDLFDLFHHS
jgi:TctA family transporter